MLLKTNFALRHNPSRGHISRSNLCEIMNCHVTNGFKLFKSQVAAVVLKKVFLARNGKEAQTD